MPVTVTPNAETALNLARLGYSVFPCQSGGELIKKPMPFIKWREASTTDERQIRSWWSKWPDAAIGLDLAKSGLIVIDADRHGKADGVASIAAIMTDHAHDVSQVPVVATPGNGQHFVYRQPADKQFGNADSREYKGRKLKDIGINIRGHGGYVIAPGTVMSDGKTYALAGDIGAAPVLPDWFAAILDAPEPPSKPVPVVRTQHSDARIRAYCDSAIKAETDRVSSAPSGTRNNTLNEAAFAVGQLVGASWIGEDEAFALLINAAFQCGLGEVEARKTIQSGLRAGAKDPRTIPASDYDEIEVDPAEAARISAMILDAWQKKERERLGQRLVIDNGDGSFSDAETGEIIDEEPSAPVDHLPATRYPAGLVGEIAKWIVDTARRPQPELAIGAALAIVGTVAGRQFCGPTRSGTHLYVLGLAPTGKGKDHPLQQISRLMSAAKLSQHVGPSEFISMPAVVNFLTRKPLSICPMDEFGGFMKRINSKRASGFEGAISKVMRTMWSSSFAPYLTPEWAQKPSETIYSPCMSIFGASTPEQFYASMEGAALEDGTLNRFLLMNGRGDVGEVDPELEATEVPFMVADCLKSIYYRSGDMATTYRNDAGTDPSASGALRQLTWCPDGSHAAYKAFSKEMEKLMGGEPEVGAFYARSAEIALRIATIVAIGRLDDDQVRKSDMEYGIDLAWRSAKAMATGAADYMADNENQANAQKIVRAIKARGGAWVSQRDLLRSLQNSIRARDLKELLNILTEAGTLECMKVKPKSGGLETSSYRVHS